MPQTSPWCDRHWARVRDDPRINGLLATTYLSMGAAWSDDFLAIVPKTPHGEANADAIPATLAQIAPICCWLGERAMAVVYAASVAPGGTAALEDTPDA